MGDLRAAVIGLGVVGQAQVRLFGDMVHATYDPKAGKRYPARRIGQCDFAVVCVGTPEAHDGSADLRFLREALDRIPPEVPVMVRSTIPPGTMAGLEKARSLVVHVPEFLNERPDGPWKESSSVPFMILGGTPAAREFFVAALDETGKLKYPAYECSGLEAELVKYTANCFLAAKVTFANEMARVCGAFGADWEYVRAGWTLDPRAGASHSKVEGPGFGGRCLPKDIAALICASEDAGYRPVFLRAVEESNARFRSWAALKEHEA